MKRLILIIPLVLLIACGKKGSSIISDEPTIPAPSKPNLVIPAQNQVCTQGTVLSVSQSMVTFKWDPAANTDSYDLSLKNLLTGIIITQTVLQPQANITLSRNTPYSWTVTAKSGKTTANMQSDTWRFYNAGPGTTNYAPFPAEIVSPSLGQTLNAVNNKVTLTWKGADTDNDILYYDVYLGNTTNPALIQTKVTDMLLANVNVSNNTTLYWKVVTYDSQGNTSDSGVYSFKVN